jgi:uncharacterized protein
MNATRIPLLRESSPAELQAFETTCQRLAGFDRALSAEWIDGWLTALAAGPRAVAIDEWLPRLTGDAFERAFADPPDRRQALASLRARHAVLAEQLAPDALLDEPDALRIAPLMAAWDEAARAEAVAEGWITAERTAELVTGAVWAEGFLQAVQDFAADWSVPEDDAEAFGQLLGMVQALSFDEGSTELARHVAATYPDGAPDRDRLIDDACYAIQDLRVAWLDWAPKPETRRIDKLPGRNDPCPCGSGRKFKRCHGAAQA